MNPSIDFSKYKRKENISEKLNDNVIDFSKYKRQKKEEPSLLEQSGRIASQFAVGAAENALLPYEFAAAPLASKESQSITYRENLFEDLERLEEQKQTGVWDQQDQKLYDSILDQIKNPEKAEQFVKTADIGVRGLAEKATGVDLHPEGILEKAAAWKGFLTNPKSIKEIGKIGLKPKNLANFFGGKDTFRSLGAGIALELAEDGNFGPIGTIGSAIVGDLIGGGTRGLVKGITKTITSPKQSLAKAAAKFTPKEKLDLQKDVIKSLRENDLPANLGTLTENKFIQGMEAKLSQSSLSGEAPEKLKKAMMDQIKSEYKAVADSVGETRFQTLHEAGEVTKEALTRARDADKKIHSTLYDKARARLSPESVVNASNVARAVKKIENNLTLGALKSPEQKKVLDVLDTIKKDLYDQSGKLQQVSVQKLMNNKTALHDIIDYEIQGGQKQLLKNIAAEIDRSILMYGVKDKEFLKNITSANKKFIDHVKTYRNDNIDRILRSQDPMTAMNKMNTVQGIRELKAALSKYPEGNQIFNDLARTKLDMMIGNKMSDNISEQVKSGKFANLLKNPKDAQIVKELLPKDAHSRLLSLMKNVGKIEEVGRKFLNASKSGTTLIDAGLIGNAMLKFAAIFSGNPWPFLKAGGAYLGARSMSKLVYDTNFLKMVEDAILASEKNDLDLLMNIGKSLESYLKQSLPAAGEQLKSSQANQ